MRKLRRCAGAVCTYSSWFATESSSGSTTGRVRRRASSSIRRRRPPAGRRSARARQTSARGGGRACRSRGPSPGPRTGRFRERRPPRPADTGESTPRRESPPSAAGPGRSPTWPRPNSVSTICCSSGTFCWMAEPRAVNLGKPEERRPGPPCSRRPGSGACRRPSSDRGPREEGRDGKHVAEQVVGEGQGVHAPRQHHAAGIGRRIGRVLHADLAVDVAADVHHHAQQHRQEHHGKDAHDADRAPLVAMQTAGEGGWRRRRSRNQSRKFTDKHTSPPISHLRCRWWPRPARDRCRRRRASGSLPQPCLFRWARRHTAPASARAGQQGKLIIHGHRDRVLPADLVEIELAQIVRLVIGLQRRLLVLVEEADLDIGVLDGVGQLVIHRGPMAPLAPELGESAP